MANSNFQEEQNLLKEGAAALLLYIHTRQTQSQLRAISQKIGVSNQNASAILTTIDLLSIDNNSASKELEKKLNKCLEICELERTLRDKEYYEKGGEDATN